MQIPGVFFSSVFFRKMYGIVANNGRYWIIIIRGIIAILNYSDLRHFINIKFS